MLYLNLWIKLSDNIVDYDSQVSSIKGIKTLNKEETNLWKQFGIAQNAWKDHSIHVWFLCYLELKVEEDITISTRRMEQLKKTTKILRSWFWSEDAEITPHYIFTNLKIRRPRL